MENKKSFYGEEQLSKKGIANYVYINTRVNVVNGEEKGYSITLKFDDKETKRLQAQLKKFFEDYKESEAGKEIRWNGNPFPGYSEDDDGNITFKFKKIMKDKSGDYVKVPLVDAKNHSLPMSTEIGSGSTVKVIYTPAIYWQSKSNFGVTLYVNKIQVLDLQTYAGSGSGLEFPEEEGYTASVGFKDETSDNAGDEEIPI